MNRFLQRNGQLGMRRFGLMPRSFRIMRIRPASLQVPVGHQRFIGKSHAMRSFCAQNAETWSHRSRALDHCARTRGISCGQLLNRNDGSC